jgi:hypothetical protein
MDLLTELGMLLFNRDNLVQATPVLERCVNLRRRKKFRTDPESLYVLLALIFCYLDLENWGKAKNFSRTTYKDCCKQRGEKDPVTLFVKQLHDVAVRKGASDSACGHHLRVVDKLSASS